MIPVTTPVLAPIVAITVLLLLQVPEPVVLDNVVVLPTHTVGVPVIVAGIGLTVTTLVTIQPVANV